MKAKAVMLRYLNVLNHLTSKERDVYERVMKIRSHYRARKSLNGKPHIE